MNSRKKLISNAVTAVIILNLSLFNFEEPSAELIGKPRMEFVESASSSCLKNQKNASVNRGVPVDVLRSYCNCYAIYMADMLNNDLLMSIARGENKLDPNLITLATNYCTNHYGEY